jgi:uncharacterized membrane protein
MSAPGQTQERSAADELAPGDALREAGQRLLGLLLVRAAQAATDRVDQLTSRLGDVARDGGPGLSALVSAGTSLAGGKGVLGAVTGAGLRGLTEKVKNVFGGGGGGKKLKVTNIVEEIDIGLPLQSTYSLWTRFEEFPSFMKKVENVEQTSDEKLNWKAQVLWSHRSWEATILEQVPDSHIVWRSTGQKGHVDGAVTFTELGPNLTRVALVLEYYPQGLVEQTGNIWRAPGRRARLELKHFRRYAMTDAILRQDEIEGWRGEIRDGQVVRDHEETLRGERAEAEGAEAEGDVEQGGDLEQGGDVEDEEEYADEDYEEGYDEDEGDEDEAEYDEDYDAEADEADYPEPEDEADEAEPPEDEPRRRRTATAGPRRGR